VRDGARGHDRRRGVRAPAVRGRAAVLELAVGDGVPVGVDGRAAARRAGGAVSARARAALPPDGQLDGGDAPHPGWQGRVGESRRRVKAAVQRGVPRADAALRDDPGRPRSAPRSRTATSRRATARSSAGSSRRCCCAAPRLRERRRLGGVRPEVVRKANGAAGPRRRGAGGDAPARRVEAAGVHRGARAVSEWSTIRVKHCAYSVPSRLIGETGARAALRGPDRGRTRRCAPARCERLRGPKPAADRLPPRHLVAGSKARRLRALRLPRGDVPELVFRRAYDALQTPHHGVKGDVEYLRILHLAASTLEADVSGARSFCSREAAISSRRREGDRVVRRAPEVPFARGGRRSICAYDALLGDPPGSRGGHDADDDRRRRLPLLADRSAILLRALKLPTLRAVRGGGAEGRARGVDLRQYLHHLAELEVQERRRRRIERYLKSSELPGEKTLATLNRTKAQPAKVQKQLPTCARAASSSGARTHSPSACPAAARRISSAPSATS
jgi:hypothetical protein